MRRGQIYTLPPREAVEVALDFVTPEQTQEADPDATEDLTFNSNLVCLFRPMYPELEPTFTQVRRAPGELVRRTCRRASKNGHTRAATSDHQSHCD